MGDPTVDTGWGLLLDILAFWAVLLGLALMVYLGRSDRPGKPKKPMR